MRVIIDLRRITFEKWKLFEVDFDGRIGGMCLCKGHLIGIAHLDASLLRSFTIRFDDLNVANDGIDWFIINLQCSLASPWATLATIFCSSFKF